MTTQEMIAVIQAHQEGKVVEWKFKNEIDKDYMWSELRADNFDFIHCDYRIKPEHHYRPFKNAEEVMDAIKKHGYTIETVLLKFPYMVSVNHKFIILSYYRKGGNLTSVKYEFNDAKITSKFVFADGTPFGVKED